jgi:hypothetical protein
VVFEVSSLYSKIINDRSVLQMRRLGRAPGP